MSDETTADKLYRIRPLIWTEASDDGSLYVLDTDLAEITASPTEWTAFGERGTVTSLAEAKAAAEKCLMERLEGMLEEVRA